MKICVIGAGFSGLAASSLLAREGHTVDVYEKNSSPGGRAWVSKQEGYTFDMGPSWYMMPEVHEEFFAMFGKKPSDYYELRKLEPAYKVIDVDRFVDISSNINEVFKTFESIEPGSSKKLEQLLTMSKGLYETSLDEILPKDQIKLTRTISPKLISKLIAGRYFGSYDRQIKKYINDPLLVKTLEFMTVFLGGSPKNIPSLYTLMVYADLGKKIWYPMGGFGGVVDAYYSLALEQGVNFKFNNCVDSVSKDDYYVVESNGKKSKYDIIICSGDYMHADLSIFSKDLSIYSKEQWQKKTVSPTAQLFYLGVRKQISKLEHHNLFFDSNWDEHFESIQEGAYQENPLFYLSCPTKTDKSVAPKNRGNVFILIPQASGLDFSRAQVNATRDNVFGRISRYIGEDFGELVEYERYEDSKYFEDMFFAKAGNAFGLAHTLGQSSIFRPPIKHPKAKGIYFTGQSTNPGTGVPLVVLSASVVANKIKEDYGE